MNIKLIVKIKNIILVISFFIFFIFLQMPIDGRKGQEFFSFFEALIMSGIMFIMLYLLFSNFMYDWLYEYGYKINYNFFQVLGLVIIIIISTITTLSSIGCCSAN